MTTFVLDCSIAAAWLFEDEASPETDSLLARLKEGGASVPNLWHLEVSNVLIQAEKRGRITPKQSATRLELLGHLPIATDPETAPRTFREIVTLARDQKLTTYDAAYLELALRKRIPLATQDKALTRAAHAVEVETLPATQTS